MVSLGISLAIALIVMAAARNVLWGFLVFFVLTIAINVYILKRKGHKF